MGKLVRDRIPELIRAEGREPIFRVLSEQQYWNSLLDKLEEEAQELRAAADRDQLEEAADVYEVLRAIVRSAGATWADLEKAADCKRAERGGFSERFYLEPGTTTP